MSVSAIAATKARTGDGPRYGRSSRRLRSMAWEPAAAISPRPSTTTPARNSQRAGPVPEARNETSRTARPMTDPTQPTR